MASLAEARLRDSPRMQGVIGFADIANALARADALEREGLAEMRERLDRSVRDLALDEFQDTSPAQWSVMEPLVDEILANADRRLLVVGDPKQSIYGWRGGTPALLESVRQRPQLEADITLDPSWRSSPVVLRFVDDLFTALPAAIARRPLDQAPAGAVEAFKAAGLDVPAGLVQSPLARALAAWPYTTHRAAPKNAAMPGLVQAYRAEGDQAPALAACVAAIVRARVDARPGATVAVLVTANAEVSECVSALRAAGIEAADEGRSPLADSAAVAVVLGLLRVADAPDDTISHWVVSREPAASLMGIVPMERHGGGDALKAASRALSARVRAELLQRGLPGWVEHVSGILRPACSRHDVERLRQLAGMARDAQEGKALFPGEFVAAVEGRMARAADTARVRVMTVHSSKGLEFDEVVLASLGRTLGEVTAGSGEWAVLARDPVAPPQAIAPVVSKDLEVHSPLLRAFRAESQVTRLGDDISSLYVALTRAREALHLVCPRPANKDDDPRLNATWFLRRSIDGFDAAYTAAAATGAPFWTYAPTDPAFPVLGELPPKPLVAGEQLPPPTAPAVERVPRATVVRAPSTHAAAEGRFFAREFAGRDDGERGCMAHAWFERIGWIAPDGAGAAPAAGHAAAAALAAIDEAELLAAVGVEIGRPVDPAVAAEVRATVARAIAGPVGDTLRAARCASWGCDRLEVRAEMPFAVAMDGMLVRGRMDRVVLGFRGGRAVRAEVIDWKTGATGVAGAAFEERIAGYRAQMDDYRRALCVMLGLDAGAVTAALAFVDRGQVLAVDGPLVG
jgi:ATP-dependent exoDNAse (exonuclease V) beta subunit